MCQERIPSALDVHMMNVHLELGQLWQGPVEWCAVWKGTVSECLGHLQEKHGGVAVYRPPECYEILPAVDGAAGIMTDGPLTRPFGA